MSDRIDHAAAARRVLQRVSDEPMVDPRAALAYVTAAQVHATLALVEQQRIANLIALPVYDSRPALLDGEQLRPDIAAALGIEAHHE